MSWTEAGVATSAPRRRLRRFGLTMAAATAVIGAVIRWKGHAGWIYPVGAAVGFGAASLFAPSALRPVERAWMKLAEILGAVMTFILLTLTFFLVITPLGVALRIFRKDLLGVKVERTAASYWIPVDLNGPGSRPDKPY